MIRWISGIALGFLFLAYILLSPSFFFNFGLIIIFGISIYELIKLRVFSLQSLLAFILIVTAILCLYLYELERSLILIAVMISVATDAFAFFAGKGLPLGLDLTVVMALPSSPHKIWVETEPAEATLSRDLFSFFSCH